MAFKIAPKNKVKMKVIVRELDGDKISKSELTVLFNRLSVSEWEEYSLKVIEITKDFNLHISTRTEDELEETLNSAARDVLKQTIEDVYPLLDENDEELEFTDDHLDWLLDYQPTLKALRDAFNDLHSGRAEQEKNSSKRGKTSR